MAGLTRLVRKVLLNLYFWPMFALVTVLALLAIPVLLPFVLLLGGGTVDRRVRMGVAYYGWTLGRIVPFMAPVTLDDRSGGYETPVVFAANHRSAIDPYLFGMLRQEAVFVTTWPFRIPVYRWVMRFARYINASEGWDTVQDQAERLMSTGCSVIIWPEGHRSRDGRLGRFKNGAFELSCVTGRPVVPVCIIGSGRLLPPGRRLFNPHRVRVVLLPPVFPDAGATGPERVLDLKRRVIHAIEGELDRRPSAGDGHEMLPGASRGGGVP